MFRSNSQRWAFVAVPAVLLAAVAVAFAAPGGLDPSFGSGGVTATDYGPYGNQATDLAVQANGRIVVGGNDGNSSAIPQHWLLRRYAADGTADASFGGAGSVALFANATGGWLYDIALDGLGRIVAVGNTGWGSSLAKQFVLVRLNGDGTLDASFGSGGVVATVLGVGNSYGTAVVVQPDGKILVGGNLIVAGTKKVPSNGAVFLARYLDDGTLDASFGSGGVTVNNLTTGNDTVYPKAIALQSDGSVLLGGHAGSVNWAITRYLANGAVDGAFAVVQYAGQVLTGLAVDGSDRIVAYGGASRAIVVRYGANGAVDSSFGYLGQATLPVQFGYTGPVLQADGKIGVVGMVAPSASLPAWKQAVTVRLLLSGALDSAFGTGGIGAPIDVFPSFSGITDTNEPLGLGLAADGGLLMAGRATGASGSLVSQRHVAWFLGKYLPN